MVEMTYEVGSNLKDKHLDKYAAAAPTCLLDGEEIRAIFWAVRVRPITHALVITNARILSGGNHDYVIHESVIGEDIIGVNIKSQLGKSELRLSLKGGETVKFAVKKEDADALQRHIEAIAGKPSPVAQAVAEQTLKSADHEDDIQAMIIGRVGNKVLDEIRKSCRPGETPEFIGGEGQAGGLVAFADRCMIIKKGALTGLMTGSVGGGRVATFMYSDITGIEYNSGWITGVLEVLTPSYQGTANKDFWRGTTKGRNADSNDPWTLSNTLPLTKPLYEQARSQIDRMRQLVADAKRPAPVAAAAATAAPGLATELAKLAELHASGILDADEFRQAKQALIAKSGSGT